MLPPSQVPAVTRTTDQVVVVSSGTKLQLSLKTGRYELTWEGRASVHDATAKVRLADGRERCESDFASHSADVHTVHDKFGDGVQVDLHSVQDGEPELVTSFWLYAGRTEVIVQVSAISQSPISTDRMLPIVADGGVDLSNGDAPEVLFVPFDNGNHVRYHSKNWSDEGESYEVGAAYDNRSRHGLVVGSLDHDTWKSAVQFRGHFGRHLGRMYAYSGATSDWTEDREPHGSVTGTVLRSPRFSIGAFDDWREGLESYGRECALVTPPLSWSGPPPTGWNSWSAVMFGLDAPAVDAAAKVVKQLGFQYVNMDAGWTNIADVEIPKLVQRIHALGLKAGIYAGPFSAWQNSLDDTVEGTDGRYRIRDIVLKDRNGAPFSRVDGGWPVDPTHPGTRMRNAWTFKRFKDWGFDYVKLDFMQLGSLEGKHFDPKVTTGIQAYNFGMRDVDEGLKGMFISLSLCPLFPSGYAHSRRISDDTFADIGYTGYMLNAATYGWWTQGTLYAFNDPDHSVIYKPSGSPVVTEVEGRTRLTASVVAGGMLLTGDDVRDPNALDRVMRLFSNKAVIGLARMGLAFRPIEGDTGQWATDSFVLRDGDTYYIALFNYERDKTRVVRVDLARAGLAPGTWQTTDLWEGTTGVVRGAFAVDLLPRGCALIRLER
jgi:hypothetical protein